jgi:hypothetical protein
VICNFGKAEYFRAWGLTGQITLIGLMNSVFWCKSFFSGHSPFFPVIPGHREAMSPESIATIWDDGFRGLRLRSAIAD